jgi:hypothetical protein
MALARWMTVATTACDGRCWELPESKYFRTGGFPVYSKFHRAVQSSLDIWERQCLVCSTSTANLKLGWTVLRRWRKSWSFSFPCVRIAVFAPVPAFTACNSRDSMYKSAVTGKLAILWPHRLFGHVTNHCEEHMPWWGPAWWVLMPVCGNDVKGTTTWFLQRLKSQRQHLETPQNLSYVVKLFSFKWELKSSFIFGITFVNCYVAQRRSFLSLCGGHELPVITLLAVITLLYNRSFSQ